MRRHGLSISEIALQTGCGKSTVARYIQGVEILPKFQNVWKSKRGASAKFAEKRRKESYLKAKELLGKLETRDQLLIASCLYWGEGDKREFGFSNTDSRLIETFVQSLFDLGLNSNRLKISLRIYEDIDPIKAKNYWASICHVQSSQIVSVDVLEGKKLGKVPYGMCRVRIQKGNDYFNLLMATIRLVGGNFAPIAQRIEPRTPKP